MRSCVVAFAVSVCSFSCLTFPSSALALCVVSIVCLSIRRCFKIDMNKEPWPHHPLPFNKFPCYSCLCLADVAWKRWRENGNGGGEWNKAFLLSFHHNNTPAHPLSHQVNHRAGRQTLRSLGSPAHPTIPQTSCQKLHFKAQRFFLGSGKTGSPLSHQLRPTPRSATPPGGPPN